MYLSEVLAKAGKLTKQSSQRAKTQARKLAFATHAAHWQTLSYAEQEVYHRRATARQGEKQQAQLVLQADLQSNMLQQERDLVKEAASKADAMVLSACTLSEQDQGRLDELAASAQLQGARGETLHKKVLECPSPLSAADFMNYQRKTLLPRDGHSTVSALTKQIARFRDSLQECVVAVQVDASEEQHYRFVFAVQQPVLVAWLPLVPEEAPLVDGGRLAQNWQDVALADFTLAWRFQPGLIETGDLFEDVDGADVAVALTSVYKAPGMLVSHDVFQPLALVLDGFQKEKDLWGQGSTEAKPTPATQQPRGKAPAAPPWVAASLASGSTSSKGSGLPESDVHSTAVSEANNPEGNEADPIDDFGQVYQEVDRERQQMMETEAAASSELFRWSMLGGAWQRERTGRAVYGVRVDIRPNTPLMAFARHYHLPLSASFENHAYTSEGGRLLAELWTLRMVELHDRWVTDGEPAVWRPSGMADLVVPAAMHNRLDGLGRRGRTRLERIRSLKP